MERRTQRAKEKTTVKNPWGQIIDNHNRIFRGFIEECPLSRALVM